MEITRVAMKKDPNGKWEMEVYVDQYPNIEKSVICRHDGSNYHYGEDENGIVSFGISHDYSTFGHRPGYMWSSRCGVFNTMFGKEIIEITLCTPNDWSGYTRNGCYYMTVDKALELVPKDFHIAMFDAHDELVFMFCQNDEHYSHIEDFWGYKFLGGFLSPNRFE